ncbi:MAG: hypothetical protein HY303_03345 [Candidatus Wallbacteria bacterium]|nr:hypothetical protein [Candidatus Wallbacteria bacterium]
MSVECPSCPVCGDPLQGSALVQCSRCATPHHRDCFRYAGVCSVFGCGEERFDHYRQPGQPVVLRLLDSVEIRPSKVRSRLPALRGRGPAHRVVVDFQSGVETAISRGAVLFTGIAVFTLLLGPRVLPSETCLALLSSTGVMGAICMALNVGLSDVLVFDPSSRSVRLERQLFGSITSEELWDTRELGGIAVSDGSPEDALFSMAGASGYLVLYDVRGNVVARYPVPGWERRYMRGERQRTVQRIHETMGIPVRAPEPQARAATEPSRRQARKHARRAERDSAEPAQHFDWLGEALFRFKCVAWAIGMFTIAGALACDPSPQGAGNRVLAVPLFVGTGLWFLYRKR